MGSSGKTGRSGGEGELRTCDDTRQPLDRRKPEWKGDSGTKYINIKIQMKKKNIYRLIAYK